MECTPLVFTSPGDAEAMVANPVFPKHLRSSPHAVLRARAYLCAVLIDLTLDRGQDTPVALNHGILVRCAIQLRIRSKQTLVQEMPMPKFAKLAALIMVAATTLCGTNVVAEDTVPESINRFTLRVLTDAARRDTDHNLVWYPTVSARSLALLTTGASETNAEELKGLGLAGHGKDTELGKLLSEGSVSELKFRNAAAIVVRAGLPVRRTFVTAGKDTFGTRTFAIPADKPVERLNGWFARTAGPDLGNVVTPALLENDPAVLILGAAAVDGRWEQEFAGSDVDGKFHAKPDTTVDLKLMTTEKPFPYTKRDGSVVVVLSVKGNAKALLVLPDEGKSIADALASFDPQSLGTLARKRFGDDEQAVVKVPALKLRTDFDLITPLKELGVKQAFDPTPGDPCFKGMTPEDVYVATFRQTATFDFDHTGFRGGAVEVVELRSKGMSAGQIVVFDRPYAILGLDDRGLIVVTALVRNPTVPQ